MLLALKFALLSTLSSSPSFARDALFASPFSTSSRSSSSSLLSLRLLCCEIRSNWIASCPAASGTAWVSLSRLRLVFCNHLITDSMTPSPGTLALISPRATPQAASQPPPRAPESGPSNRLGETTWKCLVQSYAFTKIRCIFLNSPAHNLILMNGCFQILFVE